MDRCIGTSYVNRLKGDQEVATGFDSKRQITAVAGWTVASWSCCLFFPSLRATFLISGSVSFRSLTSGVILVVKTTHWSSSRPRFQVPVPEFLARSWAAFWDSLRAEDWKPVIRRHLVSAWRFQAHILWGSCGGQSGIGMHLYSRKFSPCKTDSTWRMSKTYRSFVFGKRVGLHRKRLHFGNVKWL